MYFHKIITVIFKTQSNSTDKWVVWAWTIGAVATDYIGAEQAWKNYFCN